MANKLKMPKEIKKKIAERNLRVLIKVCVAIFVLSILTLIPLISSPGDKSAETQDYIFHYTSMAIVESVSGILAFCILKIKKIT